MSLTRIKLILQSYLLILRHTLLVSDRVKNILALVVYPLLLPALVPVTFFLMATMHQSNLQEEGLLSKTGGVIVGIEQSNSNKFLIDTLKHELPTHSIKLIDETLTLRQAIETGEITYGLGTTIEKGALTQISIIYDKTKQRPPVIWLEQVKDAFPSLVSAMKLSTIKAQLPLEVTSQLQSHVEIKIEAFGEKENQSFYFFLAGLIWMYAIYGGYYLIRDHLFAMYQNDKKSDFISHLLSIGVKPIELIIGRSIVLFTLSLVVIIILLSWVNVLLQAYSFFVGVAIEQGVDFSDPKLYAATVAVHNFVNDITMWDWANLAFVSSFTMMFFVSLQKVVLVYSKDAGSALLNGRIIEVVITLLPTVAFFIQTFIPKNTPLFNAYFLLVDLMTDSTDLKLIVSYVVTTWAIIIFGFYLVNNRLLSMKRFS